MGGKIKLTLDYVNNAFKDVGYVLLSTEYINNHTKLKYICSNGHINYMSYGKLNCVEDKIRRTK